MQHSTSSPISSVGGFADSRAVSGAGDAVSVATGGGDQMDEDTASMCKRDVGALESRIASCQNAVEAHNAPTA